MSFAEQVRNFALFAVGSLLTKAAVGVKIVHDLAVKVEVPVAEKVKRYKAGFTAFYDAIRETNNEIDDLRDKWRRDRGLNEYDRATFDALREKRRETFVDLSKARTVQFASGVMVDSTGFGDLHVTESNLQVVQFHAGQTVSGKNCGSCGRPMILQWSLGTSVQSSNDFFWGCSGFYTNDCRQTEPFGALDLSLFTRIDREEFSIQPKRSMCLRNPIGSMWWIEWGKL